MNPESPILVSVLCTAYNHEPYLRQCLDGIVMQQTDFRFEAIIHEDASVDGTRAIIEEYAERYPDIIVPIYQTVNQGGKGNLYPRVLFPASRGTYIAFCEGDDYWTDPLKLQKQVDKIEADPQCGIVCSFWDNYDQESGKRWTTTFPVLEGMVYEQLLQGKIHIRTVTALFRKSLLDNFPLLDPKRYQCGDSLWFPTLAAVSRVAIVPESTCVYRILQNSACHHKGDHRRHINFMYKREHTSLLIIRKYPPKSGALRRKKEKKALTTMYKEALLRGDRSLMEGQHIPFFPMLTLKKTLYTLLSYYTTTDKRMQKLSKAYNRHIDRKK